MYIFFDKSGNIRLHPGVFEGLGSEPLVSDKSFFFSWSWLSFTSIFDEKERNLLVNNGGSLEISGSERIVDRIHELDDLEIRLEESCLLRDLTESSLHSRFIIFDMPLGEDIFEIVTGIFPCEHEDLYIRSLFPILDTTSTLFMEFCLGHRK